MPAIDGTRIGGAAGFVGYGEGGPPGCAGKGGGGPAGFVGYGEGGPPGDAGWVVPPKWDIMRCSREEGCEAGAGF